MTRDLYRNRDFIPDFDEIMAETAARSQEMAARVEMRADVPYGGGGRERMDILFPPNAAKGAPLHLFIHGGYWRAGSKEDHRLIAAPVIAAGGIAAIVTYDLMPATRLGVIVSQVRAAACHLQGMAAGIGADPARFTVSGHSAGAHLASYLAATGPEEGQAPALPDVRGMLLVSGIYDLSGIPDSFLKYEAKMTAAEAQAWSPLTSRQQSGPLRIVTRGGLETQPFQDQAQQLAGLLGQEDPSVELRVEAQLNHLTVVLALSDPKTDLGGRLLALVAES